MFASSDLVQPEPFSDPYDRIGNYSYVSLDGRGKTQNPAKGMFRLFHFPGPARKQADGSYGIVAKNSVCGVGDKGDTMELVFMDYLSSVRLPIRSFIHFNN